MSNEFDRLKNEMSLLGEFINRELGKKENLLNMKEKTSKELEKCELDLKVLEEVLILFNKTSEYARLQAKKQIELIVTKCLQYIFESDVKFEIEIEELRNKPSAEFYVINETDDFTLKTKPELSRGGGVVDIVSLALRIAFLQIHKPSIEGPLVLDEPAKHVSEDYIYNLGEFMKETSEMFQRQIIMVTHNQHLAALSEVSYRVDLNGSMSIVKPITDA
ncbi:MAG: ATPase [Tissierellales bacterium]|nr:ATPase [Tissierellales bacterium]